MIKYRSGYKYQLVETYIVQTSIFPADNITTEYIKLNHLGMLTIKAGYASDGPSGWTIDTKNFMRGAFVHDALYQLLRQGHLIESVHRIKADKLLRKHCREDGMLWLRAAYVYHALRFGGKNAALPENVKKIHTAP